MLGKKHSKETKEKISKFFKGKKLTDEVKAKLKKTNVKYWLGKKRSLETKNKLRISNSISAKRKEKNYMWKGNNIGYGQSHKRVYMERGKASFCEICGLNDPNRFYDWANLTGNYIDVYDYKPMCKSCHKLYDNKKRQQRTNKIRV
jgi:hypothetical protein